MLLQALCIILKPSLNSNWIYSLETLNSGQNHRFHCPRCLEIWWMTLKNIGAPLLSHFKPCASFSSHLTVELELQSRNAQIGTNLFWSLWPWTLTSDFAWTSLLSMVISHGNFTMIRWHDHCEKGVTDRQMERTVLRAAWSQLNKIISNKNTTCPTNWNYFIELLWSLSVIDEFISLSSPEWERAVQHRASHLWLAPVCVLQSRLVPNTFSQIKSKCCSVYHQHLIIHVKTSYSAFCCFLDMSARLTPAKYKIIPAIFCCLRQTKTS